jgi:hypothetical protein
VKRAASGYELSKARDDLVTAPNFLKMPRALATPRVMLEAIDANQSNWLPTGAGNAERFSSCRAISESSGMSDRVQVADK